jgi:hypothetical protein
MSRSRSSWKSSAACLGLFAACPPHQTPLSVALQKMGLYEMRLPKQVWPIGTIVAVKRDQTGSISEVQDVCNPEMMDPRIIKLGESYVEDQTPSISSLEETSTSGKLSMTATILGDVKAGLGSDGDVVSSISLGISRAMIFQADAVTMLKTARKLMQFQDCVVQVKSYKSAGYEITSLSKVLVADLSYSVNFSAGTSASLEATLLTKIAGQLSAKYDHKNDTLTRGTALTFGFNVPPVSPITQLTSGL